DAVRDTRRGIRLGVPTEPGTPGDPQRAVRLDLEPDDACGDPGKAGAGIRDEDHLPARPERRHAADAAAAKPVVRAVERKGLQRWAARREIALAEEVQVPVL